MTLQIRPADPDLVRTALDGAARAGPYFVLSAGDDGRGWRPAAELYSGGLAGLIVSTGARLGVTEARVAASTVQLGYAARLWSPVLACVLQDGVVPDLTGLRTAPGSPMRLSLPEPRGWRAGGRTSRRRWRTRRWSPVTWNR